MPSGTGPHWCVTEVDPFRDLSRSELNAVADEAARYGCFLDLEPKVAWTP